MASDPQSLLSAASCFLCFGSDRGTTELIKLGLLRQIAIAQGIPMANLTPEAILANAQCFSCYASSPGMASLMELSLLQQIAANGSGGGGGGGSGQIVAYTVFPPANPADTTKPGIAYDPTGALQTMGWSVSAQTWV